MTRIRDRFGRFVSRREAHAIAQQLAAVTVSLPAFADRGEHPHSRCECWDEVEPEPFWRRWRQ